MYYGSIIKFCCAIFEGMLVPECVSLQNMVRRHQVTARQHVFGRIHNISD